MPPGCKVVLLTVAETMLYVYRVTEEEGLLFFTCFNVASECEVEVWANGPLWEEWRGDLVE